MANRNFPQSKTFGFHLLPTRVRGSITIGASGAVSSFSGPGIAAVTKTGTGVYRIQLQDNYASFLHLDARMLANGVTGSAIDPHTAVAGTLYQITTVGNTNWVTAGIPSGITPTVGQVFAFIADPGVGTGRVKVFVPSAITNIQVAGNPNTGFMNKQPFQANSGGFVTILCQGATDATTTTLIPTNPASGDVILVDILLNNSQVQ